MFRLGCGVAAVLAWMCFGTAASPAAEKPSNEFRQALPGFQFTFPRDFYSHDDFRIEWWYYTGHLEAEPGRSFGYQLTFFRVAVEGGRKIDNPSRWKVGQIYFAHMTLSDLNNGKFYFFERINRAGVGQAGAASDRLHVWNENWSLTGQGKAHRLVASEGEVGLDLHLTPSKPLVIHGKNGVSQKGDAPGTASHYFSFTRMPTEGQVTLKDQTFQVKGLSWMDHEFSSSQLSEDQVGWDWFSIQLDNGTELMLYSLRKRDGTIEPHSGGTWVAAEGRATPLGLSDYTVRATGQWTSPRSGAVYPAGWILGVNKYDLRLTVTPEMNGQELHHLRSISSSYWEGSVRVTGTVAGQPVQGRGYVELVGYSKALKQALPD
ncbi:MAG: carotenoid 1,2-hydratase [Nitrospinaceae bacterium]|nr:carotenoid 1,2-hydratase [Nitrospinaceae bacterium]NIR54061.1 carotenoid 1,2-hydratase [Nitrospinaceae bacterium]NIS84478.1 carotenoid 1,2-hydratase [Nitrospinaceae bacterium]NIT81274.1 carotenoid 1,2-hydratase [Nitrospinaceae bacterium]NIU43561.1 carotenoid 1,2-hydratase [Nitrospinaceae bacterium]